MTSASPATARFRRATTAPKRAASLRWRRPTTLRSRTFRLRLHRQAPRTMDSTSHQLSTSPPTSRRQPRGASIWDLQVPTTTRLPMARQHHQRPPPNPSSSGVCRRLLPGHHCSLQRHSRHRASRCRPHTSSTATCGPLTRRGT